MNIVLLRTCALSWLLGLLGMWVARALLALGPASLPFQVAAGFWILGGLGYTGLALHCCSAPPSAAARGR